MASTRLRKRWRASIDSYTEALPASRAAKDRVSRSRSKGGASGAERIVVSFSVGAISEVIGRRQVCWGPVRWGPEFRRRDARRGARGRPVAAGRAKRIGVLLRG